MLHLLGEKTAVLDQIKMADGQGTDEAYEHIKHLLDAPYGRLAMAEIMRIYTLILACKGHLNLQTYSERGENLLLQAIECFEAGVKPNPEREAEYREAVEAMERFHRENPPLGPQAVPPEKA